MLARAVTPFSLRLFLFTLLISALAFAQSGGSGGSGGSSGGSGGSTGGSGGGTTGTTTGRSGSNSTLCTPGSATCGSRERRPVFLSGQVLMDDGSPVPNNVQIERVCSGQPVKEAHTDSHGYFSFQVGRNLEMMNDASARMSPSMRNGMMGIPGDTGNPLDELNSGMPMSLGGEMSLAGCELRASLAGYRSSSVNLSDHHSLDNPDVGVIVLQRLDKVAGTTMSVTAYKAPKDAKKAFESGQQAEKKHDDAKAQTAYEKAVSIYPAHAEAWLALGNVLRRKNDAKGALNAYQQALQADTRFVPPYLAMAEMATNDNNWADVAKLTKQAVDLDPLDYPGAYFLNAVANYNLHQFDLAEASIKRGQRLDSQHRFARLELLMSNIQMSRQDYAGAMQSMKNYLKNAPNADDAAQVKAKISELEPLAQKRPAAQ